MKKINASDLCELAMQLSKLRGFPANFVNFENFPVGQLPPFLQHVAREVQLHTNAPISSIVMGIFSAMSTVLQGRVTVEKRESLTTPVSTFNVVSLPSGGLKSAVVDALFAGIRKFDTDEHERMTHARRHHQSEEDTLAAARTGLLKLIKRKTADGKDFQEVAQRLHELDEQLLSKPRAFKVLLERISSAALAKRYSEDMPCAACITDEAATAFAGSGINDFGMLNKIFDGANVRVTTHRDDFRISDPRMTLGIWGQLEIVDEFLTAKHIRDSGFLARLFIVRLPQFNFARLIGSGNPEKVALRLFHDWCVAELELCSPTITHCQIPTRKLVFSQDAADAWISHFNALEIEKTTNPNMAPLADLVSKQADKVARLAGLLHCIERDDNIINLHTMLSAISIGQWLFASTAAAILPCHESEDVRHAKMLFAWIFERLGQMQAKYLPKITIMKFGPIPLRKKAQLDRALAHLVSWGWVWRGIIEGSRTEYVGIQQPNFAQ